MNDKLMGSLLLIIISFVWAGSFIVVKTATEEIDPVDLGFLRFLVATPLMVLLLVYKKNKVVIPRKELPWLALLGLTGVTFLYLFQFIVVSYTNASTSAVLINTNVVFIALLSAVFLHETLGGKRIAGIILSFIGVIIIIFSNAQDYTINVNNLFFLGSVFVLLSALCWSLFSIIGKHMLKQYDMFTVTTYAFGLGTLFYLPFIYQDILPTLETISFNGWLAVLYLALFCSIFAYIGWYYALTKTEASKAAVFLNFIPLFAIVMSFFLGEPITIFFLFGASLIIYGVYLTQTS
jgi:drug/metabolite transporter (DMT)-like permease